MTLTQYVVSEQWWNVQTYVELAHVELEVALVEPNVVQAHVEAPGPGPGEALLLVLHHVDPGPGEQVGHQQAQVTATGAEVNDSVPGLSELGKRRPQGGQLATLPLQPVWG